MGTNSDVTEQVDRAQIEATREDLLDKLSAAKQRLKQLLPFNAIGEVSDEDVAEAEQSVRSAEKKLEGMGYWFDKADAQDKARADAENEAKRRKNAVDALSLMYQLGWAIEEFEKHYFATTDAASEIDRLENELRMEAMRLSDTSRRAFTASIGIDETFGTAARIRRGLGRLPRFSPSIPTMHHGALQALARENPAVLDEAVQAEAIALARQETEQG